METTIGRYEIIRRIGRGSQGSVYLGRDPKLDRLVAVKVLTATDAELNKVAEDGTPLEARMSSKLNHPNIVPIYDVGECEAGPYLIFEYVEGQPLVDVLKSKGPMSIEDAVPMIKSTLKALSIAHAAEIVHLDLSPRNILIDGDSAPRVMDFGLSQYVSMAREPRESASGTLRYMAPEHFMGDPLGTWTDVFALGSTFYELVTGKRAMLGGNLEQIQYRIIVGEVDYEPLKAMPHGEAFSRFIAGALERDRDGRYLDCSSMYEAFKLFLEEEGLAEKASDEGSSHSTIDFLLRKMQRTGDFPAISKTLSDINRLTGDDKQANADKLANVILRDFALTGKLLKLVNSSFYGSRATEITSISQAVVFLGVEQVRMTANSLAFFGHMKSDSAALKDSMTKSFLSGLIARHLAQRAELPGAEEAFISGMCQNLGENLVIFYFGDEYEDIVACRRRKDSTKLRLPVACLASVMPRSGEPSPRSGTCRPRYWRPFVVSRPGRSWRLLPTTRNCATLPCLRTNSATCSITTIAMTSKVPWSTCWLASCQAFRLRPIIVSNSWPRSSRSSSSSPRFSKSMSRPTTSANRYKPGWMCRTCRTRRRPVRPKLATARQEVQRISSGNPGAPVFRSEIPGISLLVLVSKITTDKREPNDGYCMDTDIRPVLRRMRSACRQDRVPGARVRAAISYPGRLRGGARTAYRRKGCLRDDHRRQEEVALLTLGAATRGLREPCRRQRRGC